MKTQTNASSWLYTILPPSFLAILTAIVYYPSLHYEFQFDDIANITKHFDIRHNSLSKLWFSGTRWISYWLNSVHYSIGKFDPFSYRVGNVLIHTCNGLLVFFLLLTVLTHLKKQNFFKTHAHSIAFMTALLFLLHPVQTQTVSYVIQGELEGLAALFIFGMALCLVKLSQATTRGKKTILGALLFALAVLSCGTKEIAVISPALFMLIDWFFIAQGDWRSFKQRLIIHAALFGVISTIYLWLLKPAFFTKILTFGSVAKNNIGNVITHNGNVAITPGMFFVSQFKVILHYLWMFVWPFGISVEYDWMLSKGFFAPDALVPFIGLLAIAYAVYKLLRRDKADVVAFGALWFAVAIAPRSSIIPSPELLVDYKTYTASFGWLFLLSASLIWAFTYLVKKLKNVPVLSHNHYGPVALICLFALPLSIATVQRNTVWRSGLEFWANIIQNAPGKARAYNNYGVELSQQCHKFEEAAANFKKAIAMDSKYPDPCNNLAVAYSNMGRIDDAIVALKQGLAINPYYPEGYNNLASFLIMKKELDQAEQCLNVALKLRPYYGKAYFNLGRLYLERGDQEKAWQLFKDSCTKADLDTDMGFATYAKASLGLQKFDDAIFGFKKTLELNPNYPEAKFNLANAYFLSNKYDQAIALYENILATTPQETRAWYNKGEAHVKINQPEKALICFKKVEHMHDSMPQLSIRMAGCYEKLGNVPEAKKELVTLINNAKAPDSMRQIAKGLFNQLEKHYAQA
ncbi:MAG: tetratricopeptide repeat protein [Candidatus Dependentiae bacterium]|nr:tetratricopeptide repeat protein [Candidatus Dependentiae bacterium]